MSGNCYIREGQIVQTREPADDVFTEAEGWHKSGATGLEAEIAAFKAALPGWWFTVGECQVSADASCGPTRQSEHIGLIAKDRRFDDGFHADLPQPALMSDALRNVRQQALKAIADVAAATAPPQP